MNVSCWLKTIGTSILLASTTQINNQKIIQPTIEQHILEPLEQDISKIVQDTTFLNSITKKGLEQEFTLWYEIFKKDSTQTIIYDRSSLSILNIQPTLFFSDSVDYSTLSTQKKQTVNIKNQQELNKFVLNKLHHEYTGKSMPNRKSERSIGMIFGKQHVITEGITRMAPFISLYVSELEHRNLPSSLLTIPILESSFNPEAISWAGAVGQFQFMYAAAKDYGIPVSKRRVEGKRVYDYRKHPLVAFDAFAKYMERLLISCNGYEFLAPTKYNTGPNRAYYKHIHTPEEAIDVMKSLGFAPRSYVPEMMAIQTILGEFVEDNFFRTIPKQEVQAHTLTNSLHNFDIEELLGISKEEFFSLNPQYANTKNSKYTLRNNTVIFLPKSHMIE